MTDADIRTDEQGRYVPATALDTTPIKVYARLGRPDVFLPGSASLSFWLRGSLGTFAAEWEDRIFTNPQETAFLARQGVKFRIPEDIERFLDEGHVLETLEYWYRRDDDEGHALGPRPERWTGPWEERLGYP